MDRRDKPSSGTVGAGGKTHARLTLARRGIDPSTITSKLIRDRTRGGSDRGGDGGYLGPGSMLDAYETTAKVSGAIEDAENLMRLNPEIEIAQQVLISLILSPKDFINTDINYSMPPGILPPEMSDSMIEIVKKYYEDSYNIKTKLPKIMRRSLFEAGVDIRAIIPENSLDDIINGRDNKSGPGGARMTLESIRNSVPLKAQFIGDMTRPIGRLGKMKAPNTGKMTVENLINADRSAQLDDKADGYGELSYTDTKLKFGDDFVKPRLYDNPNLLRLPQALKAMDSNHSMATENAGGGIFGGYKSEELEKFFTDVAASSRPIQAIHTVDNASRAAIGHPLIMTLPPESVIPIYVPGSPEIKVGYYVVLDETGSPITRHGSLDFFRNMYNVGVGGGGRSKLSGLLREAGEEESSFDAYRDLQRQQQAQASFQEATIRELEARASSGSLGNISLARQTQTYQIMLARAMSSMQTRILFLPAELVVFWAYDVNEDGTGRSLLENTKLISSMRGLTLVSNMESQIRNSVDHNTLEIEIDERDPNPQKTRDAIINAYALRAGNTVPWANGNPRHMAEYLALRGTNITVQGGNNYPGTKVNLVARDVSLREVDMSFDESLAKREMMGIGIPPELVDLSTRIEFSSKMAASNDLATKRATIYSEETSKFLKEDLVKQITNSAILKKQLLEVIGKNADKLSDSLKKIGEAGIMFIFLSYLVVKLPTPSNGLAQKKEDFDEFVGALDDILNALFSDDVFTATEGPTVGDENGDVAKQVKAMYRSQFIINWCREHNYMTEVIDLLDIEELDSYGAALSKDAMKSTLTAGHIVKAIGLQLQAVKMQTGNQWLFIRQALEKFKFEGDGSVEEAGEGSGGGGSYDEGGGDDGFGGDDANFFDDEPTGEGNGEPGEDGGNKDEPPAEPEPDADTPVV